MSDDTGTLAALQAAENYLAFLSQYQHGDDGPAKPETLIGGPEAEQFSRAMNDKPTEAREAVADKLAAGLTQVPDPLAVGLIAVQVGIMVENGMNPTPLAEALLTRLPADFAAARRFVELLEAETTMECPDDADAATLARLGRKERAGASAWAALQFSTMAAMTAWCRHRPSRIAAKAISGLADDAVFLGSRGGYCWYLGELLCAADGIQLTVLAPEQRKGFIVELEVVRNAAHLFALLEDTLVGDPSQGLLTGPRTDPKVAAIARGEAIMEEAMDFSIGWHYEYWWGLQPEAAAQSSGLHPLVAAMIGVEAPVDNLPEFHDQPVILMRPKMLGYRGCDIGGFFAPLHDALRSRVTVLRQLPPEEVDALCNALRADAEKLS
ncbi:MAG: hypothetical protein JXB07_15225 [Anaerolineae bacterium]|nr:hypothetical protein [Anaerolineae bacterium]